MHDVALVLVGVIAAQQRVRAVVGPTNICVVTGRYCIEAKEVGALGEARKLDGSVALDAGVRRRAVRVGCHIGVDDVLVEIVAKVEYEVVDTELLRHSTGIINIGNGTAPGIAVATPQLHCDADHLVASVAQQQGGNGRIDSAAHRAHHLHAIPRSVWERSR